MGVLCPEHSREWQSWLDYRVTPRFRFEASAAYDLTEHGVEENRRAHANDWASTIRFQQALIARACAERCQRESWNVLSLFSGIGGLDLGLERAGMTAVGQVEIDSFCRKVLAKHWPEVPRHDDVRTCVAWWRSEQRPRVDIVAGGFPCQPFSTAGRQRGTADERWGWPWMANVVRALRPRYVIMENVPALLGDSEAFGWILGDLAACGFDAEWSVLSACTVGAPHPRERLFVLAFPAGGDGKQLVHLPAAVANGRAIAGAEGGLARTDGWLPEPALDHVAHGVPKRLVAAHLGALGNAVVPQVGELVGRIVTGGLS